jgi:hypothetical protein
MEKFWPFPCFIFEITERILMKFTFVWFYIVYFCSSSIQALNFKWNWSGTFNSYKDV